MCGAVTSTSLAANGAFARTPRPTQLSPAERDTQLPSLSTVPASQ